jgi:hypothetical protein
MFFVAVFFLWPIYSAYDDGYVIVRGSKRMAGELSFYSYIIKQLLIAALFIWLGTGGSREKKPDDKSE